MNRFKRMKPLRILLSLIIVSYAIYALYDIYERRQQKLNNDDCINDSYFEVFQNIEERQKLGLPTIDFSDFDEERNKMNSSWAYSLKNELPYPRLQKTTYYCFSDSEKDIYMLNEAGDFLEVEFFFDSNKKRFSVKLESKDVLFISEEKAISLVKKNNLLNVAKNNLFYGIQMNEK